jgi:nitrile hydratase subunit beta
MKPCFAHGDPVKVRAAEPKGHCRTPYYLRGKRGVIAHLIGVYPDPERLAYHRVGMPYQPLYEVIFQFDDVWRESRSNITISAQIYQHWLERGE